jgi:hypothetical protein
LNVKDICEEYVASIFVAGEQMKREASVNWYHPRNGKHRQDITEHTIGNGRTERDVICYAQIYDKATLIEARIL